MKSKHSPSVLLPIATAFAAFSSLGAADPGAAVAPDGGFGGVSSAAIGALERSSAGSALNRLESDARASAEPTAPRTAKPAEPEWVFSFQQPSGTTDALPPKQWEALRKELDALGQKYVDTTDDGRRLDDLFEKKRKDWQKRQDGDLSNLRESLYEKQRAMEDARRDLAAAKAEVAQAALDVKEAESRMEDIKRRQSEIKAAIDKDAQDADLRTRVERKLAGEESAARRSAGDAEKRSAEAAKAAADADHFAVSAEGRAKGAADAVPVAKAAAAKAGKEAKDAGERAREAASARDEKSKNLAKARSGLEAAAGADRTARRALERARSGASKAAAAAERAEQAAKAATAKAEADRAVDPKTLGFWSRLSFNPDRSAKRAEEARAAAKAAAEAKTKAEAAVGAAEAAAKAASGALAPAEAAAKVAEASFGKAEETAKAAAAAAREAEKSARHKAEAVVSAQREAERASAEAARARQTAKAAAGKADELRKAADAAGTEVAAAKERYDKAQKETDPVKLAHEAHFREEKEANEAKSRIEEDRAKAVGRLNAARKIDLSVKENLFADAESKYREALGSYAAAERGAGDPRVNARREAAKAEKEIWDGLDKERDAFFKRFREVEAAPVFYGSDGGPVARATEAEKRLAEARAAADRAKAKSAGAEKAVRDLEVALSDARAAAKAADADGRAAAERRIGEASEKLRAAKAEAGARLAEARAADRVLKSALAEDVAARKAMGRAERTLAETVDAIEEAFRSQVEDAQARKRRGMASDSGKSRREAARLAREAFEKAKRDLAEPRENWLGVRKDYPGEDRFREAGVAYADALAAYAKAEDEFQLYFGDENTFFTDMSLSDEEADALLDAASADLGGYRVSGDRRWLARTSVNGENLLESLRDAMILSDIRDAKLDEAGRPVRSAEETAVAAKAAVDATRRRAVYGGFYFAGIAVDQETKTLLVDKGRFGRFSVVFVDDGADLAEGGRPSLSTNILESGRLFTSTNILAKLGAGATVNPVGEGGAFNFITFRQRFNALNAHPDIRKADVHFRPSDSFSYGYDEDPFETNGNTRAVLADLEVHERGLPAPIHGVVGIDNFNSMGDSDRPLGEADTWMARATLQTLDLWGRGHALTLGGNVSLGGSLYGGAASYYMPREDDARLWRSGEFSDSVALTVHGGYTDVDQKNVVEDLDVLGTGYYAGLQSSTRLVDFGASTLDLSLGVTYRYVESSVRVGGTTFHLGPNDGDGYEILPLSVALMYADKTLDERPLLGLVGSRGRTFATFELDYNLGMSSLDELRYFRYAMDEDRYLVARFQLARLQLLNEDSDSFLLPRLLFLRADAQYSSAPVVGAEQFGLGGHGSVRGYAERQFMGDRGASATIELRTPIGLGWLDTTTENRYLSRDRLQLVYFLDLGWFWLKDGLGANQNDDEFIAGAGLGLRYSWDSLVLRFDWGVPLVRDDNKYETSSAGVGHASLQLQF